MKTATMVSESWVKEHTWWLDGSVCDKCTGVGHGYAKDPLPPEALILVSLCKNPDLPVFFLSFLFFPQSCFAWGSFGRADHTRDLKSLFLPILVVVAGTLSLNHIPSSAPPKSVLFPSPPVPFSTWNKTAESYRRDRHFREQNQQICPRNLQQRSLQTLVLALFS